MKHTFEAKLTGVARKTAERNRGVMVLSYIRPNEYDHGSYSDGEVVIPEEDAKGFGAHIGQRVIITVETKE